MHELPPPCESWSAPIYLCGFVIGQSTPGNVEAYAAAYATSADLDALKGPVEP